MSNIKYYYVDENSERQGPFFLEDLAKHPLTPTTLVWRKGMPSWVKAGEVEELSFLFQTGQDAVNSGPDTEEIYRNATLSIANQQFEQARALIDELLDINPNEPRYLELQEILKQATQPQPPEPQPAPVPQPEPQQPEPAPQAEGTDDFIFCTQCGQRMSAQTERCPQCGTPVGQTDNTNYAPLEVTEIAAAGAMAQQPEPQQPYQAQPYQPQQPEPQQPYQAQPYQPQQPEPQQPYQAQPYQPQQPEAQQPYQAQPYQPQQPEAQQPYQAQPYQPQQPYQQQPYPEQPYETETETKNRFPMAAIIGAILAALVLGGVCLYMFVIRPNQSSSKDEPYEWTINEDGDTNPGLEDEQKPEETTAAPVESPDSTVTAKKAQKKTYVVVNGVNVRVRTSPALNDYNIITDSKGKNLHPNKGDRLEYLGDFGDFYKIYFKGYECYIAKEFSYLVEE